MLGELVAAMVPEWSSWNCVVERFALTHHCVQRTGNQCIMRIGRWLVLDDEPFLVPDNTLIVVNYNVLDDGPEHVDLMQRHASRGPDLQQAFDHVLQRRVEVEGSEPDEHALLSVPSATPYNQSHQGIDIQATDPFDERRQIAQAWGISTEDILGIHPVRARPDDFPADGSQLVITRWRIDDNYTRCTSTTFRVANIWAVLGFDRGLVDL